MLLCRFLDVLEEFSVPRVPVYSRHSPHFCAFLGWRGRGTERTKGDTLSIGLPQAQEPRSILAEIDDASGEEQEQSAIALAVVSCRV